MTLKVTISSIFPLHLALDNRLYTKDIVIGLIDISDPIYILLYLFNAGKEPPAPFSDAGVDNTEDGLGC